MHGYEKAILAALPAYRNHYEDDAYIGLLITRALVFYGMAILDSDPAKAKEVFERCVAEYTLGSDFQQAWTISSFGRELGLTLLASDTERASDVDLIFERLREFASSLPVDEGDFDEIAVDCAFLGLSIREARRTRGAKLAVRAMNLILWGQPANSNKIDLAAHAGRVLMEESCTDWFGDRSHVYAELKRRSKQRPDVTAIAFWAANTGYGLVRDTEDSGEPQLFFQYIVDLIEWVEPRAYLQDMPDIVQEMIDGDWMAEDFTYGSKAAWALYELWIQERIRQKDGLHLSNSLPLIAAELSAALDIAGNAPWSMEIRQKMLNVDL